MWNIIKIVDLSLPLTEQTPIYPGDPEPHFSVATTLEKDGYNLFNLALGSQSGSHVDSPYHFSNRGSTIDRVDLRLCLGRALFVDVSGKSAEEQITPADLAAYDQQITGVSMVFFRTDWYKKAGSDEFYAHPYLSEAAGRQLLDRGVMTLGIDAINLDSTGGTSFPIHDMYANAEGLIAENLAHFDQVDFASPLVSVLPLKLVGCDGSPTRAVAIQLQ